MSSSDDGKPYQIYSEIVNAGKTLQGTKRRVKWRFGWSNDDRVHEVDLVHSLVSGKKVVFEDGLEIDKLASMMSTEFSYGWSSKFSSSHIFRIEASTNLSNLSTEVTYIFLIDGVQFTDLPREPHRPNRRERALKEESSRRVFGEENYPKTTPVGKSTVAGSRQPTARGDFQSPKVPTPGIDGGDGLWDPFGEEESSSDPFAVSDPFGGGRRPSSGSTSKVSPGMTRADSSNPKGGSASKSSPGLARMDSANAKGGIAKGQKAATTSVNLLDAPSTSFPADIMSTQFEPDLLDTESGLRSAPSANRKMNAADILREDFAGLSVGSGSVHTTEDLFAQRTPVDNDITSSSSSSAAVSYSSTNLTLAPAPAPVVSIDPLSQATKQLVSLDIANPACSASQATADRQAAYNNSLPLNSLLASSKPAESANPVMLGAQPMINTGTRSGPMGLGPSPVPAVIPPPFGATAHELTPAQGIMGNPQFPFGLPPHGQTTSHAISSMGAMPPPPRPFGGMGAPMGPGGYGGPGMGIGYPQSPMGYLPKGAYPAGPGMGPVGGGGTGPMGSGAMGMNRGMTQGQQSSVPNNSMYQSKPVNLPKNSLDALDWKKAIP